MMGWCALVGWFLILRVQSQLLDVSGGSWLLWVKAKRICGSWRCIAGVRLSLKGVNGGLLRLEAERLVMVATHVVQETDEEVANNVPIRPDTGDPCTRPSVWRPNKSGRVTISNTSMRISHGGLICSNQLTYVHG